MYRPQMARDGGQCLLMHLYRPLDATPLGETSRVSLAVTQARHSTGAWLRGIFTDVH